MRIVLIGGGGFIGYHFIKRLCQCKEYDIVVIDVNPSPKHLLQIINIIYIQGNCSEISFLKDIIKNNDIVVFLAYNTTPKTSFDNPIKDINDNLPLAINLLSIIKDIKIKKLLYISSGGTVYGKSLNNIPINELSETNPISPYGITKLAIEKYCKMYSEIYNIPIVIARPSNPFGEYQIPYTGQGFISTAMAKIIKNEEIIIFGKEGTIRDYIYISDLINAFILLIKEETKNCEIFNIGSGIGLNNINVLEIIALISKRSMKNVSINIFPERNFDVPYNVLDITKIKKIGWDTSFTFEHGIQITWEWMNNFMRFQ
jgi:UDP-glucose 4-epimerase